jgi:hypothetical protein
VFARLEQVEKDELFVEPDPLAGRVLSVGELTAGYRYDFVRGDRGALGLGAAGTLSWVPEDARGAYGDHPTAVVVFLRAALR